MSRPVPLGCGPIAQPAGAHPHPTVRLRAAHPGLATRSATAAFDVDGDGVLTHEERSAALLDWNARYDTTAQLWREETGTRFRLPRTGGPTPVGVHPTIKTQLSAERLEKLPQLLAGLES